MRWRGWDTEFEKPLKQILKECSGFGFAKREGYSKSNEFLWYSVIRIIAKIGLRGYGYYGGRLKKRWPLNPFALNVTRLKAGIKRL